MEGFGKKVEGLDKVKLGEEEEIREEIKKEKDGIMIEKIKGEGGLRELKEELIRIVRKIWDENGLIMIIDEVKKGVGRKGKILENEWDGIRKDIMEIEKGIGGGLKIGEWIEKDEEEKGMKDGMNGKKYGGKKIGMEVGNEVMDVVIEDGFMENVKEKEIVMKKGIE